MPAGRVSTGRSQRTRCQPTSASRSASTAGAGTRSPPSNVQARRSTPEVMSNRPPDIS